MNIIIDSEITLRQIANEFCDELFALAQNNLDKHLCYWCPGIKTTYKTKESTLAHIIDANSKFAEDATPDFLIFYKGNLSGLISLSPLDLKKTKSEIGYWLGHDFEGKGLITRSFPAVLDYAKNNLQLVNVELSTAVTNTRSQALPGKFGFKKEKIISNVEILEDGSVDHILWSLSF